MGKPKLRGGLKIRIDFHRFSFHFTITRHFDRGRIDNTSTRAAMSIGVGWPNREVSFLVQLYRPGFDLPMHTDGPWRVTTLWFLLWRAAEGGELLIIPPLYRSWLRDRIRLFDAGACVHEVTQIKRGHRVTAMLSSATWRQPKVDSQ